MEISGSAPFGGQPTYTNPLTSENELTGSNTQALGDSETQNTVSASEQAPTALGNTEVVGQANETEGTGFDTNSIGRNIDAIV